MLKYCYLTVYSYALSPGTKATKERKKNVRAVVETPALLSNFETCECAVMIKESGTLYFQYSTVQLMEANVSSTFKAA